MDADLQISPRAIRNARMRRGMSVVELAELAGMAAKTVYEIERGNPCRISTVRRIAEALQVEVEALLVAVPADGTAAGAGAA